MIREKDESALQTPMMRQYFSVKEKYAKEIIFFRMGDFYEMFFDDAKVASEILGIALTSRSKEKDAIPMAGIPVRAVNSYLPRLLKAGKRVAICEQMEDPKDSKGLVDRAVVRVISPGTVTDERLVNEKANNYICSVAIDGDLCGMAWLDVTTGQFLVWESRDLTAIAAQISRLDPAECLLPDSLLFQIERHPEIQRAIGSAAQTPYPDPFFDRETAYRSLTEHFKTRTLEGYGCEQLQAAIQAGGALFSYVRETQMSSLGHITKMAAFQANRHVPVDRATQHALELTETQRGELGPGTLLATLDVTATAMGGRMLREWILTPLATVEAINERLDAVAELHSNPETQSFLAEFLRQVHDLERISTRISYRSATARDLVALRRTLEIIPTLRDTLTPYKSILLGHARERLVIPEDVRDEIARAIIDNPPLSVREGGIIKEGYDAGVDELREIGSQGTRWIARFQEEEIRRTGISTLKVGFHQVFGYYIEITNTHKDRIPENYVRKQTLKNCERYITPDLKEYEAKVLNAKDRVMTLELEIFNRLRDQAATHIPTYQNAARALAEVDVLTSFASLASRRDWIRPGIDSSRTLRIEGGRHPVIEGATGRESFVANDINLDQDHQIMVITGPNMAGKSTYIRQVAVLTLMAQIGCFVPAAGATIGVVDRIFTRVGAADDLTRGHSTFMVEMNETANILNNATERSLIILDEVGRGTSTFDGVSLAWAITEHIAEKIRARTLFATHYHELTALAQTYNCVRNYNFAVKEWNDEIVFLRKIVTGATDKSYGIHVARLAGIPREVLARAREVLSNLESQALDVDDKPALAAHHNPTALPRHRPESTAKPGEGPAMRQLDIFHDANEKLVRELRKLDLNRLTPMDAIVYLADMQKRLV